MKIESLLIANRGEIARRIAKTAKKMAIKTYMLVTHHEPNALHLNEADELIDVSTMTHTNIFTNIDELIHLTLANDIDAIHPGYGFLAENPEFAYACEQHDINFIGPSSKSIRLMGNKHAARDIAIRNSIPVLQGGQNPVDKLEDIKGIVKEIGFPVILKAVAGGGGKGMRIVHQSSELELMFRLATNEAISLFKNPLLLVEKYVMNPRHIEFQVLADKHGNSIHLFERECSIQRKHQKLLEEAPSSALNSSLREKMATDALKLCNATDYCSAGTVEYLLDEDGQYYFMEMNTRIQVEHPITEVITGIDLIEQQIQIAQNKKLNLKQKDIIASGWAMELRINAEDVQSGFSPCMGLIKQMDIPADKCVRCDSVYCSGNFVNSDFDSMIAKIIISGNTREEMIENAIRIVNKTAIRGIKTTLPFFKQVLQTQSFVDGRYSTSFIEKDIDQVFHQKSDEIEVAASIALLAYLQECEEIHDDKFSSKDVSAWSMRRSLNTL